MVEELSIKHQAKRGVFWNIFNIGVNQGMQFVISIILARLLCPEDYGIIALPGIFLTIAGCFLDCGFSSALIRKDNVTDKDLSTAFYFNVGVGLFFYLLLFFASPWIADFYETPILSDILKFTALGLFFGPLQSVHFTLFSRNLDFKTPALIGISTRFLSGVFAIVLAYWGLGIWSLVFQSVFGNFLGLAVVLWISPWRPKLLWSNESFKYLWNFGSRLLGSSLLDTLYNNCVPFFMGKFCSARALGIYNRSWGYAALPFNQVTGILGPMAFPVFSKLQSDEEQLNNYFCKVLRLTIFLLAGVELLIGALARPLIIVMVTDTWEECILPLQLLCIAVIFWPIQTLNLSLFSVKGRTDLLLRANIVVKIMGLATLLVALPFGVVAICATSIFRGITNVSYVAYSAGKITQLGLFRQFKEILPILLLGFSMFAIVLCVTTFIDNNWTKLIVGIPLGGIYYLGMAYLLKFNELKHVLEMLKIKK